MAIGAHPDDLEIFAYGTLAACLDRGDTLHLVVATDGAAGAPKNAATDSRVGSALAEQRAAETCTGLAGLGTPRLLGLPDGKLARHDAAAAVIAEEIASASPDVILTHDPADYHPDHRALARYVADAAGFAVPLLYMDTLMGVGFQPEYYVDTTAWWPQKEAAIMAHASQQPGRFVGAAELLGRFRAGQCNAPVGHYAEAWRSARRFPFADLRVILPPPPPLRPFYVADSDALI